MFPEEMYAIVPDALDSATCDRLITGFAHEMDDGGLVQGQTATHIRRLFRVGSLIWSQM